MSIIGKGYFINSNGAVLHVVAPSNSTITAEHYNDNNEVDKTVIKTSGWPRSGREWVQDYYIRIPEKLFGKWRFSGVKYGNTLHCTDEDGGGFTGTTNEIVFYVLEKREYLGSCYLNAPILQYDDLVYIKTNNNYSTSISCDDIIINSDTNAGIILDSYSSSTNNRVQLKYTNSYIVSINSTDTQTNFSGKTHINIYRNSSTSAIKLIQDGQTPIGTPVIGTKLYGITTGIDTEVYSPDGTLIDHLGVNSQVEILTTGKLNNEDYYYIHINDIYGLVLMRAITLLNGDIISVSFSPNNSSTLGGEGPVYFYGSYKYGSGIRDFPTYKYPVRRLSDGAIGILNRSWQHYTSPSVEDREVLSFSTGDYSALSGAMGIRTTRETWIES